MDHSKHAFKQKNIFWIVVALAVLGQIAWGLENAWFNTFTYDEITTNTQPIAIMYLPKCDCSECGYTSNQEKKVCPHCGAKMVNW